MKTADLIDSTLDWAVAKIVASEKHRKLQIVGSSVAGFKTLILPATVYHNPRWANYSTDWSQGGPLIAKEKISIISQEPPFELWRATNGTRVCEEAYSFEINNEVTEEGPTPLIAAMRCLVASKLGDEVEIPEELCK